MDVIDKIKIGRLDQLTPYQGRAALIDGEQIALFYVPNQGVFAIQNWDPIGEAYVLCRGIVGDIGGELCVASPLYKQHFSLHSGQCLEEKDVRVSVYSVEIEQGNICIGR
ncbi:nitrite reductase small subunit NirD [Vibrio sinaloensis]|uniref:nitrite reductase small subunit NirD n=1 Tax=Photobacterium sp. (strain ATCC 43367) TaxID=379097 RepID=UPI002060380C|nr:nitrite reductase small subunit NirD [Vibrio sinaloensis]UPQ89979.1 nitrite reductase small subunit NirD [Vibrio sinaloensis]